MTFTKEEQNYLLKVARNSIKSALENKSFKPELIESEKFNNPSGVFVTLWMQGDLRGCIGYIEPIYPLLKAIQKVAVKSALEDNRFEPLSTKELELVTIEISVLSALSKIDDVNKIEIGKHGLVIENRHNRGLLLPQVAVEYNWDRNEFLKHVCLKAGLPANAWQDKNSNLFIFTVEKFSESC